MIIKAKRDQIPLLAFLIANSNEKSSVLDVH